MTQQNLRLPNTQRRHHDPYTQSINEGNTLFEQRKYVEAKKKYETALRHKSNDQTAKDGINRCTYELYSQSMKEGNTLFGQGNYAQAKKKYETALQYKPNDKAANEGIKKCDEQLKLKPSGTTTIGGGSKPSIKMISIPGKNLRMSETEITIGQYLAFCKATNSHYPEWLEQGNEQNIYTGTMKEYTRIGMSESNTNYPITGVSALDADAFCRWMGGRLPTEQEWEYAARGGQDYIYAGSNDINEVAWYLGNSDNKAHPVRQKKANGYGLYDMSGNVWEFTSSTEGSRRVLRCGSWKRRHRAVGWLIAAATTPVIVITTMASALLPHSLGSYAYLGCLFEPKKTATNAVSSVTVSPIALLIRAELIIQSQINT